MLITKKHLFLFFALSFTLPILGQEKTKAVKVSWVPVRTGAAESPNYKLDDTFSWTFDVSPAFVLTNREKYNYQEFALTRTTIHSQKDSLAKWNQSSIGIRYEFGKLGIVLNHIFSIRLGGALEAFYSNSEINYTNSSPANERRRTTGLIPSFSPHLDVLLTDRIYFDVNPNLAIFKYSFELLQASSPTILFEQGTFSLDGGGFVVYIGVGYQF